MILIIFIIVTINKSNYVFILYVKCNYSKIKYLNNKIYIINILKMEQLLKFNLELKKINLLNISVIKDFNNSISERFEKLFRVYNLTSNKFYMLQELVNFGTVLENLSINKDDFVSEQLSTFSNLFNPIILKIKEVCFELNNQILNDLKLSYDNMVELEPLYVDNVKIFKSIQLFSNVKIYYNNRPREIPFEEFGICIKIPNPNDKYLFKNIIDLFGIFSLPNLILSKKIDWIWKASNSNSNSNSISNVNINENSSYLKWVSDVNVEKLEIIVEKNIETINDNINDNENDNVPSITLIKNILKQNNSGYNFDFMKKQVGENLLETNSTNNQLKQTLPNQKLNNDNVNKKLPDLVVIDDDSFNLEINKNNYGVENIIVIESDKNLISDNNDKNLISDNNDVDLSTKTKIIIEVENESQIENEFQIENESDLQESTCTEIILDTNNNNQSKQTNIYNSKKKNRKNKKNINFITSTF